MNNVAVSLIMISYTRSAINVYRMKHRNPGSCQNGQDHTIPSSFLPAISHLRRRSRSVAHKLVGTFIRFYCSSTYQLAPSNKDRLTPRPRPRSTTTSIVMADYIASLLAKAANAHPRIIGQPTDDRGPLPHPTRRQLQHDHHCRRHQP